MSIPRQPPIRSGLFTSEEIEIAMAHLLAYIPRQRDAAMSPGCFINAANLNIGIVDEVLMRLLYAGMVKRRRDRKTYVYWASAQLPPPLVAPVVLPQRLRHFMPPPDFRRQAGSRSHPSPNAPG
jgi:hypothetical protein